MFTIHKCTSTINTANPWQNHKPKLKGQSSVGCTDNESNLTMDWWHGGLGQWRGRPAEVTVKSMASESRVINL